MVVSSLEIMNTDEGTELLGEGAQRWAALGGVFPYKSGEAIYPEPCNFLTLLGKILGWWCRCLFVWFFGFVFFFLAENV